MKLNDDFSKPVDKPFADVVWVASPLAGVDRHMLDRIGDEKARATTIVRYDRDSHFSTHTHDEGEEFVVLEGTLSDSTGDFGPGVYVRNPPGSAHAPWSVGGTTIFVKLRQFDPADSARIVIDPSAARPCRWPASRPGRSCEIKFMPADLKCWSSTVRLRSMEFPITGGIGCAARPAQSSTSQAATAAPSTSRPVTSRNKKNSHGPCNIGAKSQ